MAQVPEMSSNRQQTKQIITNKSLIKLQGSNGLKTYSMLKNGK